MICGNLVHASIMQVKHSLYFQLKLTQNDLYTEIKILSKYNLPVLQYWAMWTICNFLENDVKHYKRMLIKGEGKGLILTLLEHPEADNEVKHLAGKAMGLCKWDMPVAQSGNRYLRRPATKQKSIFLKR